MIRAWRLTHERYTEKAFNGEGAYLYGGRWNNPGYRIVYLSNSIALATLEILVNGVQPSEIKNYVYIPVDIPEQLITVFEDDALPADWKKDPIPESSRKISESWVDAQKSPVLQVSSAVVVEECNFLINPLHPDYPKLIIGSAKRYTFDERLVK